MNRISIIECFVKGKKKEENLCEDAIFLGNRYAAVIDGVTSKTKTTYDGKSTGRYASEILKKEFEKLDDRNDPELRPELVLSLLDQALKGCVEEREQIPVQDYPRASVIFFDLIYETILSYGDCKCRIGDVLFEHEKRIDTVLSEKRSEILVECLRDGATMESLRNEDPGRKAIWDDLISQLNHENRSDDPYGYPVLNGSGINSSMIRAYEVKPETSIVLCSDGYPAVRDSLEASECVLNSVLAEDPLLIGNNCLGYKTTKGLSEGADSFDDRAWIRFLVTDE